MPLKTALNLNAMDQKILIEQAGTDLTWSTLSGGSVWAEVAPASRAEPYAGNDFNAKRVNNFNIRYLSTVNERMRLRYEGLIWEIIGVAHRRREGITVITAEAGAP